MVTNKDDVDDTDGSDSDNDSDYNSVDAERDAQEKMTTTGQADAKNKYKNTVLLRVVSLLSRVYR